MCAALSAWCYRSCPPRVSLSISSFRRLCIHRRPWRSLSPGGRRRPRQRSLTISERVDLLVRGAADAHWRAIRVEVGAGERATPHAAAVEAQHPGSLEESERRPVPEHDAHVAARALRMLEPGTERRGRRWRRALDADVDAPVGSAQPQPCEHIDDEAQSLGAREALVPLVGLIAVHALEKRARIAAQ